MRTALSVLTKKCYSLNKRLPVKTLKQCFYLHLDLYPLLFMVYSYIGFFLAFHCTHCVHLKKGEDVVCVTGLPV